MSMNECLEKKVQELFGLIKAGDLFGLKKADFSPFEIEELVNETLVHKTKNDEYTLFEAVKTKNKELVSFLISKGAKVPASLENTVLCEAVNQENFDMAHLLVKSGIMNFENSKWVKMSALSLAIVKGNFDLVKLFVEHGALLDSMIDTGYFPFLWAVKNGQLKIADYLFQQGGGQWLFCGKNRSSLDVGVSSKNSEMVKFLLEKISYTHEEKTGAFLLATSLGDLKSVDVLLKAGADLFKKDKQQRQALELAAQNGDLEMVKFLLEKEAEIKKGKNVSTKAGKVLSFERQEALYQAVRGNYFDVAKYLIDNKADVNMVDRSNFSLLYHAATNENHALMKLLLEKGADVNLGNCPLCASCDKKDFEGFKLILDKKPEINQEEWGRILLSAVASKETHLISFLFERFNVDPNSQVVYCRNTYPDRYSLLETAIDYGHLETADLLIEKGASFFDEKGYAKVLAVAIDNSDLSALDFLFKKGLPVDALVYKNKTGLLFALSGRLSDNHQVELIDVVKKFVENGADVNRYEGRYSPLISASRYAGFEIVDYLLENGADINLQNSEGNTVLLHQFKALSSSGRKERVSLLLERGADVNICNNEGNSAIFQALEYITPDIDCEFKEDVAIVKELLNHGVDLSQKNAKGQTPLMFAREIKVPQEVIDLLIEYKLKKSKACDEQSVQNPLSIKPESQMEENGETISEQGKKEPEKALNKSSFYDHMPEGVLADLFFLKEVFDSLVKAGYEISIQNRELSVQKIGSNAPALLMRDVMKENQNNG